MNDSRRGFLKTFLKGAAVTGVAAILPAPLKAVVRTILPRWTPTILRVSTPALRTTWPAIAVVTARAAAARAWVIAAGGAAAAALKGFVARHKYLPLWYDERFSPSLRNITDGTTR